jgi:glutamine synthetase
MNSFAHIHDLFEQRDIRKVKVAVTDIDSILRGKYISLDKFASATEGGLGFCDVVFGWDSADVLYDNVTYTGWHTGYPDAHCKLDLDTMRFIPWEKDTALFLADFVNKDGSPHSISPRSILKRVLAKAAEMGFSAIGANEYEFFCFDETPHSIREKGFRDLKPLSPGMFGYSVQRASAQAEFVHTVMDQMKEFGVEIEGMHTETGPGVYECAIKYGPLLQAADRAILFKTGIREIGARLGILPTFMAKISPDLPGCSGHIHLSLWDAEGHKNLFYGPDGQPTELARHFIGGQLALMPQVLAMVCPTINSYKRTVPNTWAPTTASWGEENRTTALRWIPGSAKGTRVEYRIASSDSNPYLAMAAALASGLWGIENKIEPPASIQKSAYTAPEGMYQPLQHSLEAATASLKASEAAKGLFGPEFVRHFVETREWEVRQFGRAVTSWEMERYFETV